MHGIGMGYSEPTRIGQEVITENFPMEPPARRTNRQSDNFVREYVQILAA